jgi:acyl-CoA thioester hydrolase
MKHEFTRVCDVEQHHVDELMHVNNVQYVAWMQELASAHWGKYVSPEIHSKYYWVVQSHQIKYLKEARLGEQLLLVTSVAEPGTFRWDRNYKFYRKKDSVLVAEASSTWVLMERETKKPAIIHDQIKSVFLSGS